MKTVLRQGSKFLYFTGAFLGDNNDSPVFKTFGRNNFFEFTPPTIQWIQDNPGKYKDYEFTDEVSADILKAKERLKELKRCAKLGKLEQQFYDEIETLSTFIKQSHVTAE